MAGQFSIGHAGFVGIGAYTRGDRRLAPARGLEHRVGPDARPSRTRGHRGADQRGRRRGRRVGSSASGGASELASSRRLSRHRHARFRRDLPSGHRERAGRTRRAGRSRGLIASLGGQNGYAGPDEPGRSALRRAFLGLRRRDSAWRSPPGASSSSGWGRALRALREDEIAAAAVGVDPTRYKVISFVIAAFGAGIAGGLWRRCATGSASCSPISYNFQFSFDAITMVILGGSGSVTGAVHRRVFVTFTVKFIELVQGVEAVKAFQHAQPVARSQRAAHGHLRAVLIALMILRPEGLLGERELFAQKRARRKDPRRIGADGRRSRSRGGRMSQLELDGVTKSFGGLRRSRDVSFKVPRDRSSGSSAPTAPARRRSSISSPASTSPTRDDPLRRARSRAAEAGADRGRGRRAHVPEHPPLQPDVGARQRARRLRDEAPLGPSAARSSARRRSADEEAMIHDKRDRAARVFELGAARRRALDLALVRQPAPPRDRARHDARARSCSCSTSRPPA